MTGEQWMLTAEALTRATKRARIAEEKLEAVREFVLSRRDDIEKEMENFGMLKPVLVYFLEEG